MKNKKKISKNSSEKEDSIKNLLKKIVSTIIPKEEIIEVLYKKKNVNEFIISKKLDLTINQTRNLLYKLADHGLVKFIRKKDRKKGGWYIYYWTLDAQKSIEKLKGQLFKKIEEINKEIEKRKNERFYYSPSASLEYTEEEALEHNFICPETGEVLELKDNSEMINKLKNEMSKLQFLIEEVEKEFHELEKKAEKVKEKRIVLEAKKKAEERAKKRKQRKKDKIKAEKLLKKKTSKKSVKSKNK